MERARGDVVKHCERAPRGVAGIRGTSGGAREVFVAVALTGAACSPTQTPEAGGGAREPTNALAATATSTAISTSTTGSASTNASLPPLAADGDLISLPIEGFRNAIVSVPRGTTTPRPVVLALHGNFDRPEWQCEVWRGITQGWAFVACPRGIPRPDAPPSLDRWTYGKGSDVRAEVEALLTAVRARFAGYVASGPLLYAGFSLGAIHGVGIVAGDGQRFPRAVLVEGGHDGWTPARAKAYAAAGGKRILFACGQRACKTDAAPARKNLEREGVETELVYGGEVGHTYDGPVAREISRAFPWLVADDPLWVGPVAGVDATGSLDSAPIGR